MAIGVSCGCGERFGAGLALADRRVRCPGCGRGVVVPPILDALIDTGEPEPQAVPGTPRSHPPLPVRADRRPLVRLFSMILPSLWAG